MRSFKNLSKWPIQGLGLGMPIPCYGWPAVLAGKKVWWGGRRMKSGCWAMLRLWFLMGVVMSVHSGVAWCVSVLGGLESVGPGYMPK